MRPKKRIGILTGGGDCSGLNALIRAVTRTAILKFGMEVIGIHDGFLGLLIDKTQPLTLAKVGGILDAGGTILGTSNRTNPFSYTDPAEKGPAGDHSDRLIYNFKQLNLSGLLCAGGDGTLTCAAKLFDRGLPIIGLPKTIDNDLRETDFSIGFDTAVANATEAIDKIHSTAQSHHRIMVVETMGRYAGWLALFAGLASGGDLILIPEIEFDLEKLIAQIKQRIQAGHRFSIVVVAEGGKIPGGGLVVKRKVKDSPDPIRLGGIGNWLTDHIEGQTGIESRVSVLGHLLRGGTPTAFDRNLASRLGVAGVSLALQGKFGKVAVLKGNRISSVSLAAVAGKNRPIPLDSPWIQTARALGIGFGDGK